MITDREILFGKRITRLRREVAELESDVAQLASLHTYSPVMDAYDLRATVRDLKWAAEGVQAMLFKLEQNRS
jgi:hypothetical protein